MILADDAPDWVPDFIASLTVGDIIAFLVVVAAVIALFKKLNPFVEKLRNFLDDWAGTEARPGVAKRPGVMERLERLETGQTSANSQISEINHQLKPNGGNSVADKVNQLKDAIIPTQRVDS